MSMDVKRAFELGAVCGRIYGVLEEKIRSDMSEDEIDDALNAIGLSIEQGLRDISEAKDEEIEWVASQFPKAYIKMHEAVERFVVVPR